MLAAHYFPVLGSRNCYNNSSFRKVAIYQVTLASRINHFSPLQVIIQTKHCLGKAMTCKLTDDAAL
jgi:hypothetical protein